MFLTSRLSLLAGLFGMGFTLCTAETPDIKALELSYKAPYMIKAENQEEAKQLYHELEKWLNTKPYPQGVSPSAQHYPGMVKPQTPRVTKKVSIEHEKRSDALRGISAKLKYSVNYHKLYRSAPELRGDITYYSTGLYAPAGEPIDVLFPKDFVGKAQIQIGCHTDELNIDKNRKEWRRMPLMTVARVVDKEHMKIANPMGGMLYVGVAPDTENLKGAVAFKGAVEAPYYIDGKTTPEEFQKMLATTGAPWGEFETDKMIATLSVEGLKKITDPKHTASVWNQVVGACYDLAQIPQPYFRKQRMVVDEQLSLGLMHSGYPFMAHHRAGTNNWQAEQLFYDFSQLNDAWGCFHEIGHNMQNVTDWVFNGTTEVSVNLFSLYVYDQVLMGMDKAHGSVTSAATRRMMNDYFADGAKFEKWHSNAFLALILFRQIRNEFGWDIYKKLFARFNESSIAGTQLPLPGKSQGDQRKIDNWVYHLSDIAKRNFAPFFQTWGVPVSSDIAELTAQWSTWMPYNFPTPETR